MNPKNTSSCASGHVATPTFQIRCQSAATVPATNSATAVRWREWEGPIAGIRYRLPDLLLLQQPGAPRLGAIAHVLAGQLAQGLEDQRPLAGMRDTAHVENDSAL